MKLRRLRHHVVGCPPFTVGPQFDNLFLNSIGPLQQLHCGMLKKRLTAKRFWSAKDHAELALRSIVDSALQVVAAQVATFCKQDWGDSRARNFVTHTLSRKAAFDARSRHRCSRSSRDAKDYTRLRQSNLDVVCLGPYCE